MRKNAIARADFLLDIFPSLWDNPDDEEMEIPQLTPTICEQLLKETEEFLCWIRQQLEK